MPRLFLHLGTHKTATTSVQRFFAQNRQAVRELGIWYPELSIAGMPDHYAHHRLAHAVAGVEDDFGTSEVRSFFDAVRAGMRDDEVCFVSAEPLYRHVLSTDEDGDAAAGYERYARLVRECVGDFDVTLMVMLRRQDLFAESLYAEHILSTGYTKGIDEFVGERTHLFDYEQRLDTWASAFDGGALDVRVFEPQFFEHSIERLFVEWLGATWSDDLNTGGRRNVTLPRLLVEYKRSINSASQGSAVNSTYRRWLERLASMPVADSFSDLGKYYLDPKHRLALLAQHAEGNRAIAERFLGRSRLFRSEVADDLAKYVDRPALSNRDHRQITRNLLRMIAADS